MRKFLERHGWIRIEARKIGCFKQVLWLDGQILRYHPVDVVTLPAPSDTAPAGAVPAVAFPAMLPAPGFGVGWN